MRITRGKSDVPVIIWESSKFHHTRRLQYTSKPSRPDRLYAWKLPEVFGAVLGGGKLEDVILAGMNPQHAIVTGLGASPTDSVGYPWNARYTIASGNLLAVSASISRRNRRAVCR